MKKILQNILRFLASQIIKKYKPRIIGITGSVGKTSAKQAIFAVLNNKFNVRATYKNYNNELGVPLTIIGSSSGAKSPLRWTFILLKGIWLLIWRNKNYPEILILEMGADRPGDIAYLTSFAPCDIGIVTAVGEAHYEFFSDIKSIVKEKAEIVANLTKNETVILNADNEYSLAMRDKTKAKVFTYGFGDKADIRAHDDFISYNLINNRKYPVGMSFKVSYDGATVPIFLSEVLGRTHVMAALAGVCVGIAHNMNLIEISESLKKYEPPQGRMRVLNGIKNTILIDDTYNSSPLACVVALDAMRDIELSENSERYAVLGDMLELGKITESAHKDIGQRLQAFNIDYLITVGERAKLIAREAIDNGFDEHCIASFNKSEEAGKFIQEKIKIGDIVLFKASQGIRLEKAVLEVMAEPERAKELLCRQNDEWIN